jgi:nitrite reductase (NADH) large subunit
VKSCVGSTWCRYGVDDSSAWPSNWRTATRACARRTRSSSASPAAPACAEAQGKDVGIIATEKGWNLYVCGNGGMKPRHAELLATDLDKPRWSATSTAS